jgi:hypothetical protein
MAAPRVAINSLPEKTAPAGADLLVIQDGTTTKKLTMQHLYDGSGISAHISTTVGAHPATAITTAVSGPGVDSGTVQGQLGQVASLITNRVINGGGATSIVVLTQAAYDALVTKVATTLYFING